jgi:hypothetical protein
MRIKDAMNIAMKVGSTVAGNVVDGSTWTNHVKVNPQNSCFLRLSVMVVATFTGASATAATTAPSTLMSSALL